MAPSYIVGFDASDAARAAVEFTRRLARATAAEVTAVHVYPSLVGIYPAPYAPTAPFAMAAHVEADGLLIAEHLFADLPSDVRQRAFPGNSVPWQLHALARAEPAALLVVGATDRGKAGRLLGSVAERVVHGSPVPVLVVPQRDAGRSIATIAVAYDGRLESRRALRAAEAVATRLDATLRLIAAVDAGAAGVYLPQRLDELDAALGLHCTELLERAARQLRRRGLEVQTRLVMAPAGAAVVDACKDGVDLLVCGSRGYGPTRSVMLGGASRHIVDHAPCPVMVMPRGAAVAPLTEQLSIPLVV